MAAKYSQHSTASRIMKDPLFWGPLAATGVGVAASAAQNAFNRFRESRDKVRGFKEMMKLHPHLKKGRDPKQVRRLYNSLSNVNPVLAKDPLVAGAWVDNVIESNSMYGDQSQQALLAAVKDLAGIRKDVATARGHEERLRGDMGERARVLSDQLIGRYDVARKEHGTVAAQKAEIDKLRQAGMASDQMASALSREVGPKRTREIAEGLHRRATFRKRSSLETADGQRLLHAVR